jgi:hypothetical protein
MILILYDFYSLKCTTIKEAKCIHWGELKSFSVTFNKFYKHMFIEQETCHHFPLH